MCTRDSIAICRWLVSIGFVKTFPVFEARPRPSRYTAVKSSVYITVDVYTHARDDLVFEFIDYGESDTKLIRGDLNVDICKEFFDKCMFPIRMEAM